MEIAFKASLSICLLMGFGFILQAQENKLSRTFKESTINDLSARMSDSYVVPDVSEKTGKHFSKQLKAGHFDSFTTLETSAESFTKHTNDSDLKLFEENLEKVKANQPSETPFIQPASNPDEQISAFVRRIFQDKNGNLWFGTNGDGVIRYDGDALKYFSINEGFGGVAVRGIVEDKEGNVWFGTEGGLTKYDGTSFINFTEKDGLINNDVWSIVIDSKGIIWIGTLQGVSRFDGEVFTPFELPEGKADPTRGVTSAKIIHSIMEDSKGRMWFGTNGGACIWDGKNLSKLSEKDGLPDNNVNCILEDKNGNFWFATHHKGVCRWDGKSFTHFSKQDGVEGTEAWDLYEDRSGNIWFPIENSGVYRYDGNSFTNFQKKQGLTTNAIQCTFEDKEGRLWLGGWMGLFRYDGKSIFSVSKQGPWPEKNKTDLPIDSKDQLEEAAPAPPRLRFEHGMRSILEDSKGNFWFGSWQEGVCRFDGEQLTYFTKADGLDRNQVRNVFEDRGGTIWFETGDTICSYDPSASLRAGGKKITIHTDRDYSSKDNWQLGAGDLWFKEDDGRVKNELEGQPGVYRYDGEKLTFLSFPLPKVRGKDWEYKCTGIARGLDGRIWFATYGSVIGYDGKSFTIMNNQSGGFDGSVPTDLHVRAIFEDSKGRLWIGNNGIGVLLQEGGKTINFTQKHGLGSQENRKGGPLPGDAKDGSPSLDRVFAIGEDAAGNIWFGLQGTQGYGAWRYDGKSLRHFTEKDGLISKHISVVYRDKRGGLWLGGDGVFKFNGKSFDRIH